VATPALLCEWGLEGARRLADRVGALIVVDVLSFSTCVDVAVGRGARVIPFAVHDAEAAAREASRRGARLASRRSAAKDGLSLSPPSLRGLRAGETLLLPSPNGSAICAAASGAAPVFAGCLRNAAAVARAARAATHGAIGVIPAGERWPDGSLRVAVEDLWGAGAILDRLHGDLSIEARVARDAFRAARADLAAGLRACLSGQELIERGFPEDVACASEVEVSACAPMLREGAFASS
jgi:2-phosphosulfolactate phosphatase